MSINELLNTMKKYEYKKDDHGFLIKVEIKKPKPVGGTEQDIQKEIADVLIADGWEVIRHNSGTFKVMFEKIVRWITANRNYNTGATKGHPDLAAYRNLYALRIEVKTETGITSKEQKQYAENGLKWGNPILIMRSKLDAIELVKLTHEYNIIAAVNLFMINHK